MNSGSNDNSNVFFFLLLLAIALCIWFYRKFKGAQKEQEEIRKENAKLIADNALLEAEHLKFQLQPHTLNNILANLKSIASKLNKGMDSLSETLDYILYKGANHLVSIEDEVSFVKKYLALNDLFISEIDSSIAPLLPFEILVKLTGGNGKGWQIAETNL